MLLYTRYEPKNVKTKVIKMLGKKTPKDTNYYDTLI